MFSARFELNLTIHQCSVLIFTYMLLLPEGQTGRSLGTFQKAMLRSFVDRGALGTFAFFIFKGLKHAF